MAGFSSAADARPRRRSTVSVSYLVLSAFFCGVGLFGMAYWLVTLNWAWFASLLPLVLGALMLFTRGTGTDRA